MRLLEKCGGENQEETCTQHLVNSGAEYLRMELFMKTMGPSGDGLQNEEPSTEGTGKFGEELNDNWLQH